MISRSRVRTEVVALDLHPRHGQQLPPLRERGITKQLENIEIERFSQDDPQHGSFDFTKFVQVDKCGVCGGLANLADAVLEFVYRSPAAITALEKSIVDRGGQPVFLRVN